MKMTQTCLNLLDEHTENRMERIKRHISAIDRLDDAQNRKAVYNELAGISRNIELLAKETRAVLLELHAGLEALGLIPVYTPLPDAPDVELIEENGMFIIKMDGLLPFPSKGNAYYLHVKLDDFLEHYRNIRGLEAPIFEERCAVIFLHHFNTEQARRRQVRDYDNLEYRCVLNVIARHFLWDDDPSSYISMHNIIPDKSNFTEVRVMKLSAFYEHIVAGFLDGTY